MCFVNCILLYLLFYVAKSTGIVSPIPSPRVFAAMVKQSDDIFMFGGTDGSQNFCDIWIFRCVSLRWERVVAVGSPASPRYGHKLIRIDKYRIAVLGGCGVCPFSEGLL